MQSIEQCKRAVWEYYAVSRRDMPWRHPNAQGIFDPYHIMVSEIMLQQTQVTRVIPKYIEFLRIFPSVQALAAAELSDVLLLWSGLGYNRRAKYLWEAARYVMGHFGGVMPTTVDDLVCLPGVGRNTAAAIAAYAYNQPAVFIETNIRTVFIHHCFADAQLVSDKDILAYVEQALPRHGETWSSDYEPDIYRHWYWALMDYGTYLKSSLGNLNVASKHYTKQSRFEGSRRQVRGVVLRALMDGPKSVVDMQELIIDERLGSVLHDLEREGLIRRAGKKYCL